MTPKKVFKNFSAKTKAAAFVFTVAAVSLALSYFVLAWSEPSGSFPTGNVALPINVSSDAQIKAGDLSVAALYDANDSTYFIDPDAPALVSALLAGNVGIGTVSPEFKLSLDNDGGIIAKGAVGSGADLTTSGAGTRLIWYPKKAAFRAGYVVGTEWDNANIGDYSTAMGKDTTASGLSSTAMGDSTTASRDYSTAMGKDTTASGWYSTAIGRGINAQGDYSVAIALSDQTGVTVSQANTMAVMGGNVGVGTTNPGAKLEVAGQVKITGGSPNNGEVLTSDAAGLGSWEPLPSLDCTVAEYLVPNGSGWPTGRGGFWVEGNVACPAGYNLTGGGCETVAFEGTTALSIPGPGPNYTNWYCAYILENNVWIKAYAVCCK